MGYDKESNDYVLQGSVLKTRAIQRLPASRRWSAKALEEIVATLYNLYEKPDPGRPFIGDPSLASEWRLPVALQIWLLLWLLHIRSREDSSLHEVRTDVRFLHFSPY